MQVRLAGHETSAIVSRDSMISLDVLCFSDWYSRHNFPSPPPSCGFLAYMVHSLPSSHGFAGLGPEPQEQPLTGSRPWLRILATPFLGSLPALSSYQTSMNGNIILIGSMLLAASFIATGCSSDDSDNTAGSGGGGENTSGSGGGGGEGESNAGGTGGSSGGNPSSCEGDDFHCPDCPPTCHNENTVRYCDGSVMGGFRACGNQLCVDGECGCTTDDQCREEVDQSWFKCSCTDGTEVQKTFNEISTCDPDTHQCPSFDDSPNAVCAYVCKDNGGSGTLLEASFGG